TCLSTLLLSVLFLLSLYLKESTRVSLWAGFGLLGGFAALTDPIALSVLPLLAGWACFRQQKQGRRWGVPATVCVLCFAAFVAPWFVRNYQTFGQFVPIRDGMGLELYVGNNGYSGHWVNREIYPAHSNTELTEYQQAGEISYMAHKQHQAMNFIGSHQSW